jgi:hypothetical protein
MLGLTAWPESIDTSPIIVRWAKVDQMEEGSCEQSGIAFAVAEPASLGKHFRSRTDVDMECAAPYEARVDGVQSAGSSGDRRQAQEQNFSVLSRCGADLE